MVGSSSVDSLPPGWTMTERIRNDGKRDKYYYAPSNGPKFNSRAEVSRYLAAVRVSHNKAKKKNKRALKNKPWKIIAVEDVSSEDLPPGWIGEIVVKERDNTIRKDPYYIDTESKTVLRSRKAVFRYLETKELDNPSQSSEDVSDEESEDDSTFSTATIEKPQLLVSRTRRQINFDQISDANETMRDHQRVDEILSTEETLDDGSKSNKKKVLDMPRRSKRLAGIELDPIPELKPRTQTHRVAAKQSGNRVASAEDGSNPNRLKIEPESRCNIEPSRRTQSSHRSSRVKQFSDNSATSEGQIGKFETVIGCNEKQSCPVFPMDSQNSPYEHKADENLQVPLDFPLGEILRDPCIAFAIKTLTEDTFDGLESLEVVPGNTSSNNSSTNLARDLFGRVKAEVNLIAGEHDEPNAVESDNNSTKLPFGGSWKDPCIEFAIRTLTDGLPFIHDPNIQQHSQQQLGLSKTQASDETGLMGVNGLDNLGQADLSSQQFPDVKNLALYSLSSSSVGLRSLCGSVLNHSGKEKR